MEKKSEKRPYQRPVLKRIELRTEEVLGNPCKLLTGSGPSDNCFSNCVDRGS